MRCLAACLFVIVLYGCTTTEKQPVLMYDVLKKGDRLTIAKPIKIEPTNGTIYFQAGKVHSWWGADVWRTLCRLHVGDSVSSATLVGSVYEVISVRRTFEPQGDAVEMPAISLTLRTISGSTAETLSCERWVDLSHFNTLSEITLEDFEDAVNGYFEITDGASVPDTRESEQK